ALASDAPTLAVRGGGAAASRGGAAALPPRGRGMGAEPCQGPRANALLIGSGTTPCRPGSSSGGGAARSVAPWARSPVTPRRPVAAGAVSEGTIEPIWEEGEWPDGLNWRWLVPTVQTGPPVFRGPNPRPTLVANSSS